MLTLPLTSPAEPWAQEEPHRHRVHYRVAVDPALCLLPRALHWGCGGVHAYATVQSLHGDAIHPTISDSTLCDDASSLRYSRDSRELAARNKSPQEQHSENLGGQSTVDMKVL